ncbi:hypothetical protein [Lederbergia panacisoli]|uniref:hypothetical protein n=1 Tax=Lederbergia panacisoli TaxID=1255251 RepID=UPI00214B243F|nr:hypothetical protein [Lederbergia panacisoli]MCR2823287.1 hypothetical protein [Lederbergia panacisoli]
MNRYLKLVNFEFNRFWKLYIVLMGMMILVQIAGVIVDSRIYIHRVNELMYKEFMSKSEVLDSIGEMSLSSVINSLWFQGPVALCGVTLLIYVFFIWYRDWFGKNTFIYRLLMLPTARIHVYLAKATIIFLALLGLVALQLLIMGAGNQVLLWMVPNEFSLSVSVNELMYDPFWQVIFPKSFLDFILYYGSSMIAVLIIFTAILFERSFRLKGAIIGILYSVISVFLVFVPVLVNDLMLDKYFYPLEIFLMVVAIMLLVLFCTLWTGHYLIKNKVRV